MKAQIIKRDGRPEYAVIPYQEYRRLLADAEMLADVRDFDAARQALAAGDEEAISSEVVDRLLDGEHPVRVWREYRGISAAELAKACGVTPAAISQIESGKRKSSVQLLQKIARALEVELDAVIAAEEVAQSQPAHAS